MWAKEIYKLIREGFESQYQESFFFPGYNLLHDDKYAEYRDTAVEYAQLCDRLMVPVSAGHFRKSGTWECMRRTVGSNNTTAI